jgi:hypothetical protein
MSESGHLQGETRHMFEHFHLSDVFTGANLVVALLYYRKIAIFAYQHTLMWSDYEQRKNIVPKASGASAGD